MDQSEMDKMQDPRLVQLENLRRLAGILEGLRPEQYDQKLFYHALDDGNAIGCAWGWYVHNNIAGADEDTYAIASAHYENLDQFFGTDYKEHELLFCGSMGAYGNKNRTLAQEINLVRGVIRGYEMLLEGEAAAQTLSEMLEQVSV
jgi:hypothetical protein